MNNSQQNKVLLIEVKKTLDQQEELISFPIQSRLTQARFHAIDQGILNNSFHAYSHHFLFKKIATSFTLVLMLSVLFVTSGLYILIQNDFVIPAYNATNSIKTVGSSEDNEDTKEEVDVYQWLYEHYG